MAVPVPRGDAVLLTPPDRDEAAFLLRGFVSAATGAGGLTEIQRLLFEAVSRAMTGHRVNPAAAEPIDAESFARGLARRNLAFRSRIVQIMVLGELVLSPIPTEVSVRVAEFADQLGVSEDLINVGRSFAEGSLGMAAIDFERNGYLDGAAMGRSTHTSVALTHAWEAVPDDRALAARWASLADLDPGTIGRGVHDFYRSRGFVFPGLPGSAPPLLAQHDWVHVLADYGSTVESEIEVFGFIARANDDPRAFSLLAMVVSLFETGYLATGAGLFEADRGHLSRSGMTTRLADAMRRGALCAGSTDFLAMDWFALADRPVEVLRAELVLPAKAGAAVRAGSVGPWQPGGMSPFQRAAGQRLAEQQSAPTYLSAPDQRTPTSE
ncbi:hypothetical protein [Mycobacterium sp.]|uniref:hypothetical protein n=1 Tax=Mycobacterium sp. TaxID=1785 RepID=UPI003D0D5D3B